MENMQENEPWNVSPVKHVFSIDLLRKKIIECIVRSVDASNIPSLRLVSKVWLADVTKILLDSGKPVYHVHLKADHSLNASYYVRQKRAKMLENFTRICTVAPSPSRVENEILPFSLKIDWEFFVSENRQSFLDFFASGIVEGLFRLEINIPHNGGSLDFLFRNNRFPSFPNLEKLIVCFSEDDDDNVTNHGSNSYFLPLLQSILDGTSRLTEFNIFYDSICYSIPAGIAYFALPRTLTKLDLSCFLTSSQLESLAINSLPNLQHLILGFPADPCTKRSVFKILDKCKSTLRNLEFQDFGSCDEYDLKAATHFAFPVMQHLDTFKTYSIFAEVEAGSFSLQTCLPNLKTLLLDSQSVNMFRKWTDDSCFPNISQLVVGLVDDTRAAEDSPNYYMNIRLQEMQALHWAFPNVTDLKLKVTGKDMRGLQYLFREMQQITALTIEVTHSSAFTDSLCWDALFTGLPVQLVKRLRKNPLLFAKNYDMEGNESSLKNLIALKSLNLIANDDDNQPRSLLSDGVFHLVLLKMPTLKEYSLKGRFKASSSATQLWEAAGRSISYSEKQFSSSS